MKAISVLLVLALVLAGALAALPLLSGSATASNSTTPSLSISDTAPQLQIACYPPPCDCTGSDC